MRLEVMFEFVEVHAAEVGEAEQFPVASGTREWGTS